MRFRLQLCCLVGLLAAHAAPAEEAAASRDFILVVDTSGSMSPEEMEGLRDGLDEAIDSFSPGDRFNLIQFASATRKLFDTPRLASEESVAAGHAWVATLERGGGTELWPPVNEALAQLRLGYRTSDSRIVLITDGRMGTDRRLLQRIESDLGGARLDAVSIGASRDSRFLIQAARLGGGRYVRVDEGADMAGALHALVTDDGKPAVWRPASASMDFSAMSDQGAAAVRLTFAAAFALLACVIIYRLRVDEV